MRCAMRDVTNRGAGDSVFNIGRATVEDLTFKNHDRRLTHDPTLAVKLPGDHAGHIFGDRYGGSPKFDNLVSQLSDINLSKYKLIKNE
jgi:hypothetical protein